MSAQQSWALQQAVYDRVVALVTGQGPGGSDVDVYDHVPPDPDRLHVRIDDLNVFSRPIKSDKTRHDFQVNVFDRPTDESSVGRGRKTAKLLQQTIIAGLNNWDSGVTGASDVQYDDGPFPIGEPEALTTGLASRFIVHMAAS